MPQLATFVGIDVAKDKLDIHIHPEGTAFSLSNTAAGVRALLKRLPQEAVVALEATGGYERSAAEGLAGAGLTVFCLHPADVRAFARLRGKRAKTDRLDAALIAQAAQVALGTRQPYRVHDGAADLKEMAACRRLLLEQLTALKGQATRLRHPAMQSLLSERIAGLQADIRRIDKAMAGHLAAQPGLKAKARRLQTAPGAGPQLAAILLAYLPEIGALSSRQAASLVGVAPHPLHSGKALRRGRCRGGRAAVRRVLYMATLSAIRTKTSPLRSFFERLKANGKPFKLAMVACMRKFITTLNAMIKNQTDWNEAMHPA